MIYFLMGFFFYYPISFGNFVLLPKFDWVIFVVTQFRFGNLLLPKPELGIKFVYPNANWVTQKVAQTEIG